ncbi:MAG: sensory histidine kinase AtoS [Methanosaeta sp. PtaU1.Bin028]|nr:MAG: sensory histidine kinase AtoS [Methanosaeta sp. PtaU1.Bin028]
MHSNCDEHGQRHGLPWGHAGRFLTEAIASLPDAILAIDTEGRVVIWNRAMEKLTGVLAEEMIGKGNYEYALPFYGVRRPILADMVLMPDECLEMEYNRLQKEGTTLVGEIFISTFGPEGSYIWAKAAPLYHVDGRLAGAIESIRDISDRKRAEEALIKSEQEKEAILSGLKNVAVEYLDPGMRMIWVNSAVQKSCGKSMEELRGERCFQMIQGIQEPCPGCRAVMTLQDGRSHEGEITTPDGRIWATRSNPIRGADGELKGVVHVAVNITRIKAAEQNIRSVQQRLAQVIDFLPDATFVLDGGGRVMTWNKALEKMTGTRAEEMIGKGNYEHSIPFYGIRRPALADLVLQPDRQFEKRYDDLQRDGSALVGEVFIPSFGPEGSHIWVKATPLYDPNGSIIGAIEAIRDITDRKKAEEAIASMKQRLSDVIEFLPDATFAIDMQGRVIAWNRAIEKMTGAQAKDMIGEGDYRYSLPFYGVRRPILADLVLEPDEDVQRRYPGLSRDADGKTLTAEIFIPSFGPTGSFIWAKATPLYDSHGNLTGSIESIRDVTEMRRTEETLERSRSELRIASDIQRSFLPERVPPLKGFDLAAASVPAMEVGGDFYDFIPGAGGRLGIVIADVSGKSVPAALFMALSRTIVRANATHHESGVEVLQDANDMICADSRSGMFVTLFYGVLNEGSRDLVYANAGHSPPILFSSSSGEFVELDVTGIALGVFGGMEYEERRTNLSPGDVIVLYTDGVTEAVNHELKRYGTERLRSIIRTSSHLSAQGILDRVLADISSFSGAQDQFDDITMIVVRVRDDEPADKEQDQSSCDSSIGYTSD